MDPECFASGFYGSITVFFISASFSCGQASIQHISLLLHCAFNCVVVYIYSEIKLTEAEWRGVFI